MPFPFGDLTVVDLVMYNVGISLEIGQQIQFAFKGDAPNTPEHPREWHLG